MNMYEDVVEFHKAFGHKVSDKPAYQGNKTQELRVSLILEEVDELVQAIEENNLADILDGALDLIYVTLGTLATYGINPDVGWNLVHASNMAKLGGTIREDGKILKPAGWCPPDLENEIARQVNS